MHDYKSRNKLIVNLNILQYHENLTKFHNMIKLQKQPLKSTGDSLFYFQRTSVSLQPQREAICFPIIWELFPKSQSRSHLLPERCNIRPSSTSTVYSFTRFLFLMSRPPSDAALTPPFCSLLSLSDCIFCIRWSPLVCTSSALIHRPDFLPLLVLKYIHCSHPVHKTHCGTEAAERGVQGSSSQLESLVRLVELW